VLGNVETVVKAEGDIFYVIQQDNTDPSLLIAGTQSAVIHINKTSGEITTVSGNRTVSGYQETRISKPSSLVSGSLFNRVSGIKQSYLSYIIADRNNHCLRSINKWTGRTSTQAGNCTRSGWADGKHRAALFTSPGPMVVDISDSDMILIAGMCIRTYDSGTSMVSTLPNSCMRDGKFYTGIFLDMEGEIFVLESSRVLKYTSSASDTALKVIAGNERKIEVCSNCSFIDARFESLSDARFVLPTVVLVVESGSHRLWLLNMTERVVLSLVSGENGTMNGYYREVKVHRPQSLTMDESFIYIGEDGNLRKVAYSG